MSTSESRQYLSAADTAKLVRKHLKADFPNVKFSVRSKTYSGGASINVRWTDGPMRQEVESVCGLYTGASFDGMIDLKSYHDSLLMTDDGPISVHFGADFIFANRDCGKQRAAMYKREVERFIGQKIDNVDAELPKMADGYHLCVGQDGQLSRSNWRSGYEPWSLAQAVQMIADKRPWFGATCDGGDEAYCPTCQRWQADHRAPHLH